MTSVLRLRNEGVCFFILFLEFMGDEEQHGGPGLDVDVAAEDLSMLNLF